MSSEEELGRSDLSTRHKQNRAYAERARSRLRRLWGEERDAPLCVLTELGRIKEDATFQEAVLWYELHAHELTAKQAAARIRAMRLGTTPEAGPATLFNRLMRTVRDFRIAYPHTSRLYVEHQLEHALQTVRALQ